MKYVDVVLTRSKKLLPFFSWAVMLWTGKNYSHVARKLNISLSEIPSYYQASEGKVNYETESIFVSKHKIVKCYTIEVSDEIYDRLGKIAWENCGKPYGMLQNLGIVLVDIAKLFKKDIKNPFKKGVNCSELLYIECCKLLDPKLNLDPDKVKPHHIEKLLQNELKKYVVSIQEF